jgi:hypothetical protein
MCKRAWTKLECVRKLTDTTSQDSFLAEIGIGHVLSIDQKHKSQRQSNISVIAVLLYHNGI